MKKRIVCMILILAFALSVLSGCLLPVNAGRDLKQTIATVTYKGNVATVSKLDAVQSFYTYGSSYVSNYGMTEEDAFMYVIEQLANRKLLVLDAIDRGVVKGDDGQPIKWDNATHGILKASLPAAIVNEAQDEVNVQIEEIYKQYVETVNEEYSEDEEVEEEETEEEETDERTVRPLPTLEDEEEEKVYSETVESWLNKTFNYETDWEEYGAISKNVARIAFNRLKKLFEDQYYVSDMVEMENIFLQSQYEQIIVEKLQESLLDGVAPTDAEVVARYAENLKKNEATFNADDSAYASAFSNNEILYYHPEAGYATVKHILLSFEEANLADRKAENTHIYYSGSYSLTEYEEMAASGMYGEEGNTALSDYRTKLVETLTVNNYGKFEAWWNDGEGYDEDEMSDLIDWRDLVYDADNLTKVSGVDFLKGIHTELAGMDTETKLEAFTNYIFGYSNPDDSGMFNNTYDYTVRPDEDSYMEEFTNICLYLISGKNASDIESDTDNYFVFGDETGKVGSMAICVTDYGIHLVMISHIANANVNEDGYYMIDTANVASAVEEMKKIEIGDTERTTLYDYIYETLKGAKETNKISVYQQNLINGTKDAVVINQDIVNRYFGK